MNTVEPASSEPGADISLVTYNTAQPPQQHVSLAPACQD